MSGCRRPWHATSAASVSRLCKAQKVQLFSRKIDPVSDQWSTTASRRWFDVGPASPTLDQHRISGGLWYGVSLLDMNGRRGSAHVCVCGGGGGGGGHGSAKDSFRTLGLVLPYRAASFRCHCIRRDRNVTIGPALAHCIKHWPITASTLGETYGHAARASLRPTPRGCTLVHMKTRFSVPVQLDVHVLAKSRE